MNFLLVFGTVLNKKVMIIKKKPLTIEMKE